MRASVVGWALGAVALAAALTTPPTTAKGPPADIAAVEGTIWVTGGAAGAPVRRLDPATGRVTGSVRAGRFPAHLAAGFGALWVTGREGVRLHRVDPRRGRVIDRIELGRPTQQIVAGARAVWASGSDRRRMGVVTRVDPATGRVTGRFHMGRGGAPLITTGHGDLWIGMLGPPGRQGEGRLVRVDGRTRTLAARVRLRRGAPYPWSIAVAGEEGWLLSPCGPPLCDVDRGFLTRLPAGPPPRVLPAVPLRRGATSLAVSREAAWVVHTGGPGSAVTRVDRRTGASTFQRLTGP